jgi:hypothetical protein
MQFNHGWTQHGMAAPNLRAVADFLRLMALQQFGRAALRPTAQVSL